MAHAHSKGYRRHVRRVKAAKRREDSFHPVRIETPLPPPHPREWICEEQRWNSRLLRIVSCGALNSVGSWYCSRCGHSKPVAA